MICVGAAPHYFSHMHSQGQSQGCNGNVAKPMADIDFFQLRMDFFFSVLVCAWHNAVLLGFQSVFLTL